MALTRRFNEFCSLKAKFASAGSCGHPIKEGDTIGYAKSRGRMRFYTTETCCESCWTSWRMDNYEAASLEAYSGYGEGY
jgi:hypothetical protein